MKCLCFSDSHGDTQGMRRALNMHRDAEAVFFLGDGLSDFENFIYDNTRAYFAVRGNWDSSGVLGSSIVKSVDTVNLCGVKITFTHGNYYGVKYGLDGVTRLAEETSSKIILFGHTHTPLEKYIPTADGGIYLFNPGSIGGGFGIKPSYGIINITDSGIMLSHGYL